MKEYIELLKKILYEGVEKESGRANMPNTWGIEFGKITMDMKDGFPLLTTKKMFWKGIVHELLWFLRGETNIKYLVDNKVNVWVGDAYRWYTKYAVVEYEKYTQGDDCALHILYHDGYAKSGEYQDVRPLTIEEFTQLIKDHSLEHLQLHYATTKYTIGDLGKVYGHQWRNQNGVDQIQDVIDGLRANPYSRYHIIDGWNKADFPDMALPPCHLLYQFIVKPLTVEDRWDLFQNMDWKTPLDMTSTSDDELHRICDEHYVPKFDLNLNMYQRSCDTFLGVPFNITSMSLLLMIIAKVSNMVPGTARWLGGDVHLYMDHIPVVKKQINMRPKPLPTMLINKELFTLDDITDLTIDDFVLLDYESGDKLKGELFTGNKK